jgi:hypothetical protein
LAPCGACFWNQKKWDKAAVEFHVHLGYTCAVGLVSRIGRGYYAIESEDDEVSADVKTAIDKAFAAAAAVPSSALNIQLTESADLPTTIK